MGNVFGGRNSFINKGLRDVNSTVVTAGRQVSSGLKSVSSDTLSQARASLLDIQNLQKTANKGDVGKFVSNQSNAVWNIAAAPVNVGKAAITGGDLKKEFAKIGGSTLSFIGGPQLNVVQSSPWVQKQLEDKTVSKYTGGFSKNAAGAARGVTTLTNSGNMNSADRTDFWQYLTKLFGGAAAIGGGAAAYGALTAPAPAAGAIQVASGPAYYGGGVVTSSTVATADVAVIGSGASGVGAVATAGSSATPWLTGAGVATSAYSAITGKKSPGDALTSILNPGSTPGPDLSFISDLFPGGRTPASDPFTGMAASGSDSVVAGGSSTTLIYAGFALVAGYLLYRKYA